MTAAASQMFVFYANLLSVKAKYVRDKIVVEQTKGNPYVHLQGVSQLGLRGMSRKSFTGCVLFHLFTVFPINAAEQEEYYNMNVLKKPQHVNVCQFVHQVEQLNAYIAQMPCFYYSPNANASTKPENIPFMEAELGSHVPRICPIQWQDQYNMNEKGMTPMDMHLFSRQLKRSSASAPTRRPSPNLPRKLLTRVRKGRNVLVPSLRPGFPRRSVLRSIATCARGMGARIPCKTLVNVVGLRKTERRNPISTLLRKAVRKQIPLIRTLRS
jgi:hypothetical protein